MKREIKFRDISKVMRDWCYGDFFYWNKYNKMLPIVGIGIKNGSVLGNEIFINTLTQFTGLKDKNGKEIYEGDIIKSTSRNCCSPHAVIYYAPLAAYCGDYGLIYPLTESELKGIEVIGNIHENPKLLKTKTK